MMKVVITKQSKEDGVWVGGTIIELEKCLMFIQILKEKAITILKLNIKERLKNYILEKRLYRVGLWIC